MADRSIGYIRLQGMTWDSGNPLEGIELDKIFTDVDSSEDGNRPQLNAMIEFISEGDIIFVQNIDQLSQNLDDCNKIVTDFMNCGAKEVYLVESGVLVTRSGMVISPKILRSLRLSWCSLKGIGRISLGHV